MKFKIFILLIFTLAVKTVNAQKEINLYGNLEFGSHEVGVKHLTFVDTLRGEPREIHIRLWYPSKGNSEQLKFSDYLDYKKKLNKSELLQDISIGIGGKENLFSTDSLVLILHTTMKAAKEAEAKKGKFPLLIWSIRYGTIEYQNIISEYITSHGYIVAFPENIPNSSYPWQFKSAKEKEEALYKHITDINTSIKYLKHQQNIDSTKIGLLSWSYAGESAILTQMDNLEIDLVVGLSSIGFTNGVYLGKELSNKVDIKKLNVPYLILSEQVGTNGKTKTPPNLFNSMHSNSRYLSFRDLTHGNFNVLEGMIPGILRTNKVHSWSKGGAIAQTGYEAICEITLSFLDAIFYEENFVSFDEHISKIRGNLPEGFFTITTPKKE